MRTQVWLWIAAGMVAIHNPVWGQNTGRREENKDARQRVTAEDNQDKDHNRGGVVQAEGSGIVESKGLKVVRYNNVWALSIGISDYAEYPDLTYATADAIYFHDFIEKAFKPDKSNTNKKVLTNQFQLLKNEQATRQNVIDWINVAKSQSGQNDLIILYFAGHGYLKEIEGTTPQAYLLMHKADPLVPFKSGSDNYSIYSLMNEDLPDLLKEGRTVLVVLDACHSGSQQKNIVAFTAGLADKCRLFLSCGQNQFSYEKSTYGGGHGVFTWRLVHALAGEADRKPIDNIVTADEVAAYLPGMIMDKLEPGEQQTPFLGGTLPFTIKIDPIRFREFYQPPSSTTVQSGGNPFSPDQQQLINQLREALSRNELLSPAPRSVVGLFAQLYRQSAGKEDLLAPIFREWSPVFQNEAQQIFDAYYKQDKIDKAETYQRGADLLTVCLTYPRFLRSDELSEMQAQQSFMTAYALLRQDQLGQLTINQDQRISRFRELITKLAQDTARTVQAAPLHNAMGLIWASLGDTTNARLAYRRASRFAPNWVMPVNNLATMLTNSQEKISNYQQALRKNPRFYIALLNVSKEYKRIRAFDKAQAYLDTAMSVVGQDAQSLAEVYLEYGLLYEEQGTTDTKYYQKAIVNFEEAVRKSNAKFALDNELFWKLGLAYANRNEYAQSVKAIDQYLETASEFIRNRDFKGAYNYFIGRMPQEQYSSSFYAIGYLYEKGLDGSVRLDEARRWYQFAANMHFRPAIGKLQLLGIPAPLIANYQRNLEKGFKRLTIPLKRADGILIKANYYLNEYPIDTSRVYEEENNRLKAALGTGLSDEVTQSFQKLYRLAIANNVSYQELCLYALQEAEKDKQLTAVQKEQRAIKTAQEKAETFVKLYQADSRKPLAIADSVLYYTRQAVLALPIDLQNINGSVQLLLDSLRKGTDYDGLLYYAVGHLYEHKPDGAEWTNALKWYTYSFQVGYKPAYFRLQNRYRRLFSPDAIEWITSNFNRPHDGYNVTCRQADGTEKKYQIFLHDYPQNPTRPIEGESQRLRDVFGVTPTESVQKTFADIYLDAAKGSQSFNAVTAMRIAKPASNETATALTESDKLVEQGDAFYNQDKYPEAAAFYQKAIEKAIDVNERSWCYVKLGNAQLMLEQYEPAIRTYQTSIALQDRAGAYSGMSIAYRNLKDYNKSLTTAQRAAELLPKQAFYLRNLANAYYYLEQYENAITTSKRALELEPGSSDALGRIGLSLRELKRYDESLSYFNQAIQVNPKEVALFEYHKGGVYQQLKQTNKAIDSYEKAIAANPKDADYQRALGAIYYNNKMYEKATVYYLNASQLGPNVARTFKFLGDAYYNLNQWKNAMEAYKKAVSLAPTDATYATDLADAYSKLEQIEQAIQSYSEAGRLAPTDASVQSKLGLAFLKVKRYDEAITCFRKAIDLNPANAAIYYYHLGYAYGLTQQWAASIEAYRKAVDLDPNDSDNVNELGDAYFNARQYELAIATYRKATELSPSNDAFWKDLGDAYYNNRQFDLAVAAFMKVLAIKPNAINALNSLGISLTYLKRYEEGLGYFQKGINQNPNEAGVFYYNIACNYALQGKTAAALENLETAIAKYKYGTASSILADTDFVSIRNTPAFQTLLATYFPK